MQFPIPPLFSIIKQIYFLMFMCGELFAQGHRLCNNSNGFRLTKQYIQDDEFITSEAPELSAKLESGADLTADELDLFKQAYEHVVGDTMKTITTEFEGINKILEPSKQLSLVCADEAEALAFSIAGHMSPSEAAEKTFNSIDYEYRSARQAGRLNNITKHNFHMISNAYQWGFPRLAVNGEKLNENILRTFSYDDLERLTNKQLLSYFEKTLSPTDYTTLTSRIHPQELYTRLGSLEIGDGGIISIREPIYQFAGNESFLGSGHGLFFQRTSREEILIFDPLATHIGYFVNIEGDSEGFQNALTANIKDTYQKDYKRLIRAQELPADAPNREAIIQIERNRLSQFFGVTTDQPIESITADNIYTITFGAFVPAATP